jgi:putative transposase
VQFLRVGFAISQRRACQALGLARSSCRYRSLARDQGALRIRLRDLAAARVRYGYRRLHILLRREGWVVNHKRVFRLYRLEGLGLQRRRKPKRVSAGRLPHPPAERAGERWSLDFVSDRLADGRSFRVLTLVDNVSRVSPALEADFSLSGARVVQVLDRAVPRWGRPQRVAVDNGPEFISKALDAWAYRHGVQLEFNRPGKPTDNAFIESFNGHFREECLAQHWFDSLAEARAIIEAWRVEYNTKRPHRALGQACPVAAFEMDRSPSKKPGS